MNFSNTNSSLKDVMKRAEEEDVMVYAIGLAGQNGPPPGSGYGHGGHGGGMGRGPMGRGGMGHPGIGGFGGGHGGFGRQGQAGEKPDEGLSKIAAVTGGGYFELTSTSDLASTFARVADELHHQYALGFTPASLDGKMHTLEISVAGTGLTARARKRYLARSER
jgi:VWFA-related protein